MTETELSAQWRLCEDFNVKKNLFGYWQIEFTLKLNEHKTIYLLRTRRSKSGEVREFKSLDAAAKVLSDCGIKEFQVNL